MTQEDIPFFKRTALLAGPEGLQRLREARVTVVGLGAVGSFAVEALARSGIGHLRLIDFDVIHESNINRQLYALPSTIGEPKIELALKRVQSIHPDCEVRAESLFITEETAPQTLCDAPDILLDAIDSVNPKTCLLQAALEARCHVISAMGAATRTDPTLVRIADISETYNCPLAKFIRKRLRRRGIERGIRCVFSIEPPSKDAVSEETDHAPGEVRSELGRGRPRNTLGSYCAIPAIFGLTAAQDAINTLLNIHRSSQ
ncbi:MAG: tRNA threonylcarbamoyladenosine dehydratase [Kiritimatiellae bacterium]|nr:tRNA threonylcarbamoyladenosine dehydratase [Kiritimatiellia bacterium]